MYHPSLPRFLQTDPIGYGDGMNMYAYVGSDTVNRVDPTGMCDAITNEPETDEEDCSPIVVTQKPLPYVSLAGLLVGWSGTGNGVRSNDGNGGGGTPQDEQGEDIVVNGQRIAPILIGSQRGGQNQRATEFRHLTDEQVKAEYDNARGEKRVKLQRELKARGLHGGGKVRVRTH